MKRQTKNRITQSKINSALRVYGSKSVEDDTLPGDFHIRLPKFRGSYKTTWGDYMQEEGLCERAELNEREFAINFPRECPRDWLNETTQRSSFAVMWRGATTPYGFYSSVQKYNNLKKAMEDIESRKDRLKPASHYGVHALYLGKVVEGKRK